MPLPLVFLFVLGVLWIIFRSPHRNRGARDGRQASAANAEAAPVAEAEMLEKLESLEERIRVLERIVTDDRRELRQQFRDLD